MKKQIERFLRRKRVREILGDDFVLTEDQTDRLLKILVDDRSVKRLEDWLPAFANFIKYDLANYLGRFKRLQKLSAAPNLYNMVLRYGKVEGTKRYKEYVAKKTAHFDNILSNQTARGLSEADAKRVVREIQAERGNLAAQVLRGTSEHSIRSVAYWLKHGLTAEEAKSRVREIQTTNGKNFYGDDIKKQQERNEKWLSTLRNKPPGEISRIKLARSHSIEGCMARGLDEENAEIVSNTYFKKRNNFSNISQKCFDMVSEQITDGLYYKSLNYEKQISGKCVDLYDAKSNVVVEFYGDFWHANPLVYRNEFMVYDKFAAHVRLDDKKRISKIEKKAPVFIVWESEFRKDPTGVVESIVDLIRMYREGQDIWMI